RRAWPGRARRSIPTAAAAARPWAGRAPRVPEPPGRRAHLADSALRRGWAAPRPARPAVAAASCRAGWELAGASSVPVSSSPSRRPARRRKGSAMPREEGAGAGKRAKKGGGTGAVSLAARDIGQEPIEEVQPSKLAPGLYVV